MMEIKFNTKSWRLWAMVVGIGAIFCALVAGAVYFRRTIDLEEHPIVENVMDIVGIVAFVSAMVLAVVLGRQFSVTWARRLFWLDLASLVLFALMALVIWYYRLGWMPFCFKLIGGVLFQLSSFVCLWSFLFSWGMISRQTLRRHGFRILCVVTPPVLFLIWLIENLQTGPLKPGR